MSKVSINESTLTAIGAAIREKTGKNELIAPGTMPEEIRSIVTGGDGPTDEELTFTGNCTNKFSHNGWNWFIEKYGDRITTNDINNGSYMFYMSSYLKSIPFELNFSDSTTNISGIFDGCSKIETPPKINNIKPEEMSYMFNGCSYLRVIPDDYCNTWDWSYIDNLTSSYGGNLNGIFNGCQSLRKFPVALISHANRIVTSYYSHLYYGTFQNCICLDEVNGLYVHPAKITSNFFQGTLNNCYRLKNFTFAPYEGSVNWSNQTIDVGGGITLGYCRSASTITGYNSGITADKEVKDDATYQALKDDPDWFATKIEYSRYNHDSAVNTINSLPTTTGTGCTIKFRGASGSLTDGGAINTLTEEEIAVAAAKGWTITLT